jgi:hypothetical protein
MYARSALEEMRDRISRFEYEKDLGVFMREVSGLLGRSRLCS